MNIKEEKLYKMEKETTEMQQEINSYTYKKGQLESKKKTIKYQRDKLLEDVRCYACKQIIKQEKRDVIDPAIEQVIDVLRGLQLDDPEDNTEANLNYILSRLLDKMYTSNYREINNAVGMLFTTALEYYRRVAGPYEDQKRHDEGDVYDTNSLEEVIEQYVEDHADD